MCETSNPTPPGPDARNDCPAAIRWPGARGLLLVEFVTAERWVFNGRYFPFMLGAARTLGLLARWVCVGSEVQLEKSGRDQIRQRMVVGPEELSVLQRIIEEVRPSHVVVSDPISAQAMACLRGGRPEVSILSLSDQRDDDCIGIEDLIPGLEPVSAPPVGRAGLRMHPGNRSWELGRTDWFLRWLGLDRADHPSAGKYMVGAFTPSYDAIMANGKASAYKPHLIIMGGLSCDHFSKLADNDAFAGLDMSDCVHDYGCAYCTWFRGATSDLSSDPVELAAAQLRRVKETAGTEGRFCGIFDVHDIRNLRRVDAFFDMVLELGLPPATFCFEPRVDRVLEVAERLASVLPRLHEAGHRIYLFRMGAENLVDEENARYNKHVTLAQMDEVRAVLGRLARAFPDTIESDPTYGYITVSPWTTLEMFDVGIRRAIERDFEPLGVWLYTPLLLFGAAPITLLAERHGLLVDQFDDIAPLYEPSVNQVAFSQFRPWRFQDDRTGVAFALIVRYCAAALRGKYPDTLFRGDELYERLLSAETSFGPFARPDLFACEVIACVRDAARPFDKQRILDSALVRLLAQRPSPREAVLAAEDPMRHRRLRGLAEAVRDRFAAHFPGLTVLDVQESPDGQGLSLRVSVGSSNYELDLRSSRQPVEHLFQTEHFSVAYRLATPLTERAHVSAVHNFVRALDRVFKERAPEFLPSEFRRHTVRTIPT